MCVRMQQVLCAFKEKKGRKTKDSRREGRRRGRREREANILR